MDLDDDELLATQISRRYIKKELVKKNYIKKDIIRDKIKELEELPQNQYIHLSNVIYILNEFLEEN